MNKTISMKHIFLLFIISILFSCQLSAQEKKVWTLREVVDHAVSNNLTLKRSLYSVEGGEINAMQAKMAMLPTINGSASYGFNWGRSIDPTTNQFVEQRINSINGNLSSSLLLWNGFRLFYNMKQSETELNALNEDLIKARNDVILSVITLYLNVVFNKELYTNAELQLNSTNEQLARTKKLAEAGSVPRANVLLLEAQSASNELNLIQRENALNLSLLQLKQALQLPASTPMDVETPQVEIDAQLPLNKSSEEIFEIAMLSMPEIKAARLRQRSSSLALKSARGSYYPRLSLNGSISTLYSSARKEVDFEGTNTVQVPVGYVQGDPSQIIVKDQEVPFGVTFPTVGYQDQFKNNLGKGLGFSLTVPIFNGFNTRSAVQRAAISNHIADISFTENENRLRQSVETAYTDAVASAKTYVASDKQVNATDEAFRVTKQRFENGAVNFVDYQTSENDLFRAKSDLLRAIYDFIFMKKVLDFYLGLPLEL
jgi:outer membrane protein